ncbi:heavy-metal-associated domain-containing protein [Budviciaceae bacterium BWR-B9]|uniref:Heavy-metal-associated domain-containing protein n=2 Tax=Limnobaculum TaxID=2172100 RepID=A0A411WNI8_9GAMM|nr:MULTISPECIES: heavy metal-associated domain-containing protein [Limnobaculum]MBK5145265.1 heavy-metal-associated domain-containing protein [Limnobaculum allomyrinae]MBV7693097.1 cation transporter [Limnobaculum sp. M2-1]QBH97738.1 heavy-metal-associated domain-containing protein [Limnobaculum zhutongyuii]TQS87971.1 heavy-metal-associated domain-containing protein [Limnobaculum zhutongyuii]
MKRLMFLALFLFSPLIWAENVQVTIDVKGMTCPLCVSSVNQALRKTDGVIKAKASLKTQQAEVIVPEGFNTDELLKSVDKTGYKGSINKVVKQS